MILSLLLSLASHDFSLATLDLSGMHQDYGEPRINRSVENNPLTIAGKVFATGVGTHAKSQLKIDLAGHGDRFHAMVGLDGESAGHNGSVKFRVVGDGTMLWESPVMRANDAAVPVDVDIRGKKVLSLIVTDAGDGIDYDHADWAEAWISMLSGKPKTLAITLEKQYILTPKPKASPRLTGPTIFGVRPGSPFLFTMTATGDRPMLFTATDLPEGLSFNSDSGIISGVASKPGEYKVHVDARNARGHASRILRVVVGDKIALTPPLGWNSWNCWADSVSQEKVLQSARAMAAKLKDHGWSYVNIDDGWQGVRGGKFGGIMPNKKFPDMGAMVKEIHSMGLKSGIYSTPWQESYASYIGGSSDNQDGSYAWSKDTNENGRYIGRSDFHRFGKFPLIANDVKQWADWGIDYMKYDWNPLDVEHVKAMSDELKSSGRDIFYSLSNSADFRLARDWANLSNSWRTTGDINDSWGSVTGIWSSQDRWHDAGGPGHWNDPDMLVVGKLGWGSLHPSKLTPSEQYSHISLWCLLSAPLLIGCDLDQLDPFTLNLLTNDDVLDVDQDALGKPARQIRNVGGLEVWSKEMEDGSRAIGFFNQGDNDAPVSVKWNEVGLSGSCLVRDLWRQRDLGGQADGYEVKVKAHGAALIRVWAGK